MINKALEKGKIYPAIVTDFYGSYETQALLLERDLNCPHKDCVNVVIYPVAGSNEDIEAEINKPEAMGVAGIEKKVTLDEEGKIIVNQYENVSCHETSPNSERGHKGSYMPPRYIELLNKFRTGKIK